MQPLHDGVPEIFSLNSGFIARIAINDDKQKTLL